VEVSGKRLWGLARERYGTPAAFFRRHFVANYCPLAFLEQSGRNRTPDKLPAAEREELFEVCDDHLEALISNLGPRWVVGVGNFAYRRVQAVLAVRRGTTARAALIPHPSPASPRANAGWAAETVRRLEEAGIW
jgi:single-strand selective monofunctional uracil DNA glycosylase